MVNVTPSTDPLTAYEGYNYLALICGVPLILIIILGNVLVCLSVLTERSLKTATNYFIVSLAVADLLLAVLVLPLYVYSEVNTDEFLYQSIDFLICPQYLYLSANSVIPLVTIKKVYVYKALLNALRKGNVFEHTY